ncbi:hypothetical protein GCM10027440_20590 [Nocardiopsis coralliicola]
MKPEKKEPLENARGSGRGPRGPRDRRTHAAEVFRSGPLCRPYEAPPE